MRQYLLIPLIVQEGRGTSPQSNAEVLQDVPGFPGSK